jgi:hypothetical protein
MSIAALVESWRGEAALYRRRGLHTTATLVESMSDELEIHLRQAAHETVSLTEGAELSGYDPDSLGRMIREGKLENVGRKNAPRIRVLDLPRKPGCVVEDATVPVLHVENRRGASGLETSVERGRVRLQRGGDAS